MASELDEQKKLVLPYLQRAEEIAQVDPKVAYYCRLYAIDQGLRIPKRAKEIDGLLKALLVQLEKDKQSIILDAANDKYACETFALNIFKRADKVDRAGRADVNTSKAYYAASIFIEVLNQFGEIDADLFEKQRYSVWRAAEIRKAIREGRPPVPPPSADPSQQQAGEAGTSGGDSLWDSLPAPPAGSAAPPGSMPGSANSSSSGAVTSAAAAGPQPPAGFPSFPAAAAPAPPRYRPGSKVLHCPGGQAPIEPGTVGKVTPATGAGSEALYMVALRAQIVQVPESQLAPELPDGARVLYCAAAGAAPVGAAVLLTETDQWPPVYTLECDDGEVAQATPAQLLLLQQEEQPAPPTAAAPPPPMYPSLHSTPAAPPAAPAPSYPAAGSSQPARPSPRAAAPPAAAPSPPPSVPAAPAYSPVAGYQPPLAAITEAQKAAKYAASSLAFEDVASAVKYLNDALRLLTVPGASK